MKKLSLLFLLSLAVNAAFAQDFILKNLSDHFSISQGTQGINIIGDDIKDSQGNYFLKSNGTSGRYVGQWTSGVALNQYDNVYTYPVYGSFSVNNNISATDNTINPTNAIIVNTFVTHPDADNKSAWTTWNTASTNFQPLGDLLLDLQLGTNSANNSTFPAFSLVRSLLPDNWIDFTVGTDNNSSFAAGTGFHARFRFTMSQVPHDGAWHEIIPYWEDATTVTQGNTVFKMHVDVAYNPTQNNLMLYEVRIRNTAVSGSAKYQAFFIEINKSDIRQVYFTANDSNYPVQPSNYWQILNQGTDPNTILSNWKGTESNTITALPGTTQLGDNIYDSGGNAFLKSGGGASGTLPWASIIGTPTTLAGYGITDGAAYTASNGIALVGNNFKIGGATVTTPIGIRFLNSSAYPYPNGKLTFINTLSSNTTGNTYGGTQYFQLDGTGVGLAARDSSTSPFTASAGAFLNVNHTGVTISTIKWKGTTTGAISGLDFLTSGQIGSAIDATAKSSFAIYANESLSTGCQGIISRNYTGGSIGHFYTVGMQVSDDPDLIGFLYKDKTYDGRNYDAWIPSWGRVKSRIDSAISVAGGGRTATSIPFGVASGTNTYTATIGTATSYNVGDIYEIKFASANTGASTININGIGVVSLLKFTPGGFGDLVSGDIAASQTCLITYDGSHFQFVQPPANINIANQSSSAQTGSFKINGASEIDNSLTLNNGSNNALIINGSGNIQFNGSKTWYVGSSTDGGNSGLEFSRTGNPYFQMLDGGVFNRGVSSTNYNVPWNVNGNKTGQTSTQNINTLFTQYAGMYTVAVAAKISSVSGGNIVVSVSWTDENGTSQTANFYNQGSTTASLSTTGVSTFPPMTIYSAVSSNITVTVTTTGTITYDAYATMSQL